MLIKKNVSISELSSTSGISRVTLSKIFNNKNNDNNLSLSTCLKLAVCFDIYFPSILVRSNLDEVYTEKDYLDIFIKNIYSYLKIEDKKQKILSISPGVSESTISEILNRKNQNPRMETLYQLSAAIDISVNKLFEESDVNQ